MSGAIATAYVKLIPTFDKQLSKSIKDQLSGVDGKSAGSKVGKLFSRGVDSGMGGLKTAMTSRFSAATVAVGNIAAKAFGSVASAVGSSMDAAVKRVDTMNNFPRIMEGMGIGADAAQASIRRLSAGIDGLPTALDDAVSGVQRFTSKNGDIAKSTDYFLAVNNAIASGGQSMEIQSSALEQLSQSYSKGKMDMMEWRSLQQAMPAQLNQIAEAMGMTADELGEGLRKGDVSMDQFMDKIVELNEKGVNGLDSFADQARKATGGIGTAMTNVQNRINKAVAGVIDAIGQENIANAINSFSSQFGKIGSIFGAVFDNEDGSKSVVGFVGGLKRGLESAFAGWTPKFGIDWESAFGEARKAAEKAGEWLSKPLSAFAKSVDENMSWLSDVIEASLNRLDIPEIDWNSMADGASRVVTAVTDFSFDALGNAISTLSNIGSKLQEVFGPFLEQIAPGLESFGQGVSQFFAPIADFVAGNGPAFEGMMERIYGHINDAAPILDELAGHFNNLATNLEPIAGPLGQGVAEVLGNIFSTIFGLGTLAAAALNAVVGLADDLVEGITRLGSALGLTAGKAESSWGGVPRLFDNAKSSADGFSASVGKIPGSKTTTINVVDNASATLNNISAKLASIGAGVIANVYAKVAGVMSATGSIADSPYIPRHASGYIAKGPTLTNNGWVGEDGAEAVLNWGTGGTVVPLTNHRYMEPIAKAIAHNMDTGPFDDSAIVAELQALHRDMARMRVELDGRQVGKAVTPQVSRNLGWEKAASERGF